MDIAFGVANGVLQASDNVDDVVVVARGDHSRPGGVLIVRIVFRVIRQKAHVNPFTFASHFSGEALQVTIAVAKEDFTGFAPLSDGGPTRLEGLDASFGFFHPCTVFVEVVTCTTVRSHLVGLVRHGGNSSDRTVRHLIHTVGNILVGLEVVVGPHGLGILHVLVSVDDNALCGLGSELGSRWGANFFTHNSLFRADRG